MMIRGKIEIEIEMVLMMMGCVMKTRGKERQFMVKVLIKLIFLVLKVMKLNKMQKLVKIQL